MSEERQRTGKRDFEVRFADKLEHLEGPSTVPPRPRPRSRTSRLPLLEAVFCRHGSHGGCCHRVGASGRGGSRPGVLAPSRAARPPAGPRARLWLPGRARSDSGSPEVGGTLAPRPSVISLRATSSLCRASKAVSGYFKLPRQQPVLLLFLMSVVADAGEKCYFSPKATPSFEAQARPPLSPHRAPVLSSPLLEARPGFLSCGAGLGAHVVPGSAGAAAPPPRPRPPPPPPRASRRLRPKRGRAGPARAAGLPALAHPRAHTHAHSDTRAPAPRPRRAPPGSRVARRGGLPARRLAGTGASPRPAPTPWAEPVGAPGVSAARLGAHRQARARAHAGADTRGHARAGHALPDGGARLR